MRICIYEDYYHNNAAIHKVLANRYGKLAIDVIDANDIFAGALNPEKVDLFIVRGGESRYIADKLNGRGNDLIRKYVENGGSYLGICCGAYYACAKTEWHSKCDDYKLEITNDLALFNGVAKGPIEDFPCCEIAKNEVPAQIANIEFPDRVVDPFLYWGGSLFEGDMNGIDVLARYHDLPEKPPAIIMGTVGKGKYILSSPHIEFDPEIFDLLKYNCVRNAHEELNKIDGSVLSSYFLYECINRLT